MLGEEESNRDELEPLVGMDPRKVLARVLKSSIDDVDLKSWSPPGPDELEEVLENYEVRSLVGRGGMGAVYEVHHKELHRVCALKLLPLSVSERPDFEERFLREARAMASLHHPNIVHIYDFGRTQIGHLYYVMEYVEGADLSSLIREGGVSYTEALNVVSQVSDALEYAHEKGYVHRDVKPGNVLLNGQGQVKVVDFGLAKIMANQNVDSSMTLCGEVMGTPGYMSPEQTVGGEVDHRADIYALGVMLYEMLTGSLPQGNFELPSKKSGVDESLDKVVLQALHQKPEDRYQSAADVKQALTQCGGNVATSRAAKKGLVPVGITVLCAVALALGGALFMREKDGGESLSVEYPTVSSAYENSLGMKLIPVRGTQVLFGETETKWSEWDQFLKATDYQWSPPTLNLPSDHAIINISWDDAQAFCQWLTETERQQGRIGEGMKYRLPSDQEWSAAIGVITEVGTTPEERFQNSESIYTWGSSWPAPLEVEPELDLMESTVFEVVTALRQAEELMGADMNLTKIRDFKQMTYFMRERSWSSELAGVVPVLVDLPEHTARLMQTATDQAQFRHWNGKTVVLMHRWMASRAEIALPMVGWDTPDWTDSTFREFFVSQNWGFESGLTIFTPAKWDGSRGCWMLGEKEIPRDLFFSEEDSQRFINLKLRMLNGRFSFQHDTRHKVCYPVVIFDGELDEAGVKAEVVKAYTKMQDVWYEQVAKLCDEWLPSYESEWKNRSQSAYDLWKNKFGLYGCVGGAKEWVQDAYREEGERQKTLRGGAVRLKGRGPLPKAGKKLSSKEGVKECLKYAVSVHTELLAAYREEAPASTRRAWYGFRPVLEVEK